MNKRLLRLIPSSLRPVLKKIYYFPADLVHGLKNRDRMFPPPSMMFVGDSDFERTGQEFLRLFIELGDLQPSDRVLDVGCGVGRMAIPLTNYLTERGEYWGLDIVKNGIEWCQSRISSRFNNFHFQHSDIYNEMYNPGGGDKARDFRFPFDDEVFDFVFLTSVFTHMLPADLENYLREISRVLKKSGRCLMTFFILNNESINLVHSGLCGLDFKYEIEGCLTTDKAIPESAVAYHEDSIRKLLGKYRLSVVQPVHYGSWCGRKRFLTYQDVIIAEKR